MTKSAPDLPIIEFDSPAGFETWLAENHESPNGLWLKIARKASGITTVTYDEALDVALCYGWIDGQRKSFDEKYFIQKFTPRRARSKWSKRNREKVAVLIEQGRMQLAGLREIERAKSDGRWDAAYDSPANATVPPDLQARLDEHPEAQEFFDTLNSQNRYAILYRIQDVKCPETRTRRIEKFVEMLRNGETPY